MTRAELQRRREAAARKRRDDGVRESKVHPWRAHNPGWLKSDRGHRSLPDKCMRVLER